MKRLCTGMASLIIALALSSPLAAQDTSLTSNPEYEVDTALVALGTISAANVYYSYLTIGTAADSYVSGIYDGRLASTIAREVSSLNAGAISRLQAMLTDKTLSADDQDAIRGLIQTYQLINLQADSLIRFISDKNDEGDDYQNYRTQVWSRIQVLFGK